MPSVSKLCSYVAVCLAFFPVLGGGATGVQTQDTAQARAQLEAVRARIAALTARLGSQLKERDAQSARVRESELLVTEQRRRLEALNAEQAGAESRRAGLRSEATRTRGALDAQRAALAAQIRAAYMIGSEEPLKLLLNQNSPAALGRTLAWYRYFAERRGRDIEAVVTELARLDTLVQEIDAQSEKLAALRDAAAHDMNELQHAREQRSAAVAQLNAQLSTGNQELGRLKREEQAVESLVAELSRVLQDFPDDPSKSFGAMRGKLPWPVAGKVTARYQAPRARSSADERWNGIMIDAQRGAKVRAPYFGRVVYADWLQGLGMLIIIGHSGGFMTLYGHAEVLYKKVGDAVVPGDVLAALSDSDAAPANLYFEIRDGRKTVDPKDWLRPNP